MTQRMTATWIDATGLTSLRLIPSISGASGILTALQNHSNARVIQTTESVITFISTVPVTGSYPSVIQTASLLFTDGMLTSRLNLVAPKISIFGSDGISVPAANIPDIISAAIGNLVTSTGVPVTSYIGGSLIQGRMLAVQDG